MAENEIVNNATQSKSIFLISFKAPAFFLSKVPGKMRRVTESIMSSGKIEESGTYQV